MVVYEEGGRFRVDGFTGQMFVCRRALTGSHGRFVRRYRLVAGLTARAKWGPKHKRWGP